METQSKVTVGRGTLNVTEPVGWYEEDILWSIVHPELCLESFELSKVSGFLLQDTIFYHTKSPLIG